MIEHKYNFVYKTTNNLNGDYYYGVHSTEDLNDGYIGSGLRLGHSIKKYGKENFTREYVKFFDCRKDAYLLEAEIVTPELLQDPHCMNIAVGGYGGYVTSGYTNEEKQVYKENLSNGHKGQTAWNKNKPWPEEVKQKLCKPKTEEHKQKLRESAKHRKPRTKDSLKKFGEKMKGKNNPMSGKNSEDYMTPEAILQKRNKLREQMKNRCPINNGIINKRVKQSELDLFLNNGWTLGYLKK